MSTLAGSLAAMLMVPGAAEAASTVPAVQNVQIRGVAFAPAALVVRPGTRVTWRNGDEDPHTVVASNQAFRSGALAPNGAFSFTFTRAGEYVYFCSLHPHMVGRVVVRAS
jgi:plastocyanin